MILQCSRLFQSMKFSFSVLVPLLHFKIINFMGLCKTVSPWCDVSICSLCVPVRSLLCNALSKKFQARLSLINTKYFIRWSRGRWEQKLTLLILFQIFQSFHRDDNHCPGDFVTQDAKTRGTEMSIWSSWETLKH